MWSLSSFLLYNILCVGNIGCYLFNISFELLLFCINLFLAFACALERKKYMLLGRMRASMREECACNEIEDEGIS